MDRSELLLATSLTFISISIGASGQPSFQTRDQGPAANQVIDTAPIAARGQGTGIGGPPSQLMIPRAAGANPTLSCGTGSTVDANATNMAGTVTVTSSATASCAITFATPFQSFNHCVAYDQHGGSTFSIASYSYSVSSITVTGTSLSGTSIDYFCSGY